MMNQLTRLNDFAAVLTNYTPSAEAADLLKNIHLTLLVGPSSSGRNTIINELLTSGNYHYIVSDTTRQPRVNNGLLEQNGREYWFRSEVDILSDLQAGQFLEAAVIHGQQVSGISIRELANAGSQGKIAINEIEIVGADNIHAAKPDADFIFVLPPSFDEWIVRMNARGELPAEETKRRVQSAIAEISTALNRDYYQFVVNDTFMHASRRINSIALHGETVSQTEQAAARTVAEQLLTDTAAFTAKLR